MKKLVHMALAIGGLVLTVHGSVHAQASAGEKTRAEVIAELQAARASGWLAAFDNEDGGSAWLSRQPFTSGLTRAMVKADLAAARASGELQWANTESGVDDMHRQAVRRGVNPSTAQASAKRAHDAPQ